MTSVSFTYHVLRDGERIDTVVYSGLPHGDEFTPDDSTPREWTEPGTYSIVNDDGDLVCHSFVARREDTVHYTPAPIRIHWSTP